MPDTEKASYDDVSIYDLTPKRERELLEKQVECVFMWANKAGHPIGVVMNYIYHEGRIWLTATSQRARIRAIRRDPRVSVTVSSMGTDMGAGKTVTYKGTVIIHQDQATKDWFYPALGELLNGYPATSVEAAYPDMVTAVANRLAMRFPLGELAAPLLMAQLPMRLGIEPGALSPVDRARGTKVPVLVLSGSLDRRTTPADTRRLFGAFAGEKWLVLFDGARHQDLRAFDSSDYDAIVSMFINDVLTPPHDNPATGGKQK